MALITSRRFKSNMAFITKNVVELRNRMIENCQFAIFHASRHDNKKPLNALQDIIPTMPVWAGDILQSALAGVVPGKNEAFTEDMALEQATKAVMFGFMDKAEADKKRKERRDAAAKRKKEREAEEAAKKPPVVIAPAAGPSIGQGNAKPQAGKKGTVTPSVVTSPDETFCLKHGDEVLELSQGEYDALVEQLMKMRRAPAKKVS